VVAVADARRRARSDLTRLVHRGLAVPDYTRALARLLHRAVPFDGECLLTFDPVTLLPTGEVVENGLPADTMPRLTEIELSEPDFNKFTTLARAASPAASLSDATAGDLDQSARHREIRRPSGFEDELRVVLQTGTATWGALTLLREQRRVYFTTADVRYVASLAPLIADGLRRALLLADAHDDRADEEAGLIVLAPDDTVELANRVADDLLAELQPHEVAPALPLVVRAVAGQARRSGSGHDGVARARVRTRRGRWLVVRGSLVGGEPEPRVAVMLESARAPELAPLIADAYGLSERERSIAELVAQGLSTKEIANRLFLSPYTVQDLLKSLFEKTGAGSRGEVVARLFFEHFAPRLTANPPAAP
jgi:DNA-binding CsgD family transcriptional regulator